MLDQLIHFAGDSQQKRTGSSEEKQSLRQLIMATISEYLEELTHMEWHFKVAVILMVTMGVFLSGSRQPLPAFCQDPVLNTEELNNIQAK